MLKIKRVLVILLLVLPMFALAPTLVAGPNEALMIPTETDTALPAALVGQNLRVAVYVESNVTLPAYAEGGIYTDFSANIISFLQGERFAVTSISTQDILDHKLLAANYDAFVLPNQLPKDEIVDLVKDYWLAGGSILSFEGSIGYCFYAGMIDESLEGNWEMAPFASPGYWAYSEDVHSVIVQARHPVTQAYDVDDEFLVPAGNITIINGVHLPAIVGSKMTNLVGWNDSTFIPIVAAFEDPNKGGRIVQVPGNCSTIPVWERPIITDAIDWLAPKPKARVAFDFTHTPFYGVDDWDTVPSLVPRYNIWRDFLVNHTFTCDKLYPTGANLTSADLAPFDVLIISRPALNYSLSEMDLIRAWVEGGKSLFYLTDYNSAGQARMNELLLPWDISVIDGPNMGTFSTTDFNDHPTLEGVSSIGIAGGEWLNVSGSAYPIVNQSTDVAIAAAEPGLGRIIVSGDINWIDYTHYMNDDNLQFGINLINWLSSSTAKVLVYADTSMNVLHPNYNPFTGPVAQALNDLGIPFYMTADAVYFNMSLFLEDWDMIVYDNSNWGTTSYQPHLIDFVAGGGKVILSTWSLDTATGAYFGVKLNNTFGTQPTIHLWEQSHPIFNLPADYNAATINTTLDLGFGVCATNYTTYANATPLAGYTAAHAGAAITLGAQGKVIVNGPLLTVYNEDTDDSTYPDNQEIWENEIAYLFYGRPMINHPDDVTYMETETGNEISWTPVADAGPWEYIVRENGSIIESGYWGGGTIDINVDGVNASITDYQLTVYDKLGYSVSDLVVLNVTEYVAPTTPGGGGVPIDPMILVIIAAAGVVVIIIIVIVMKKKK